MVDFSLLRVSLTKNGYFKIAALLKDFSRMEVLDHLVGVRPGINIIKSQVANMLDANPATGLIPEYWDAIREHGDKAIDAFAVFAMLLSHERLIRLMQSASQGRPEFTGYFLRGDFDQEKEYTNLAYSLACFGLSQYRRGSGAVRYDLSSAVYHLRSPATAELVQDLLRNKLQRAGWRDPDLYQTNAGLPFLDELRANDVHRVFSMEWARFAAFLDGRLRMAVPTGPFGLREVGLF